MLSQTSSKIDQFSKFALTTIQCQQLKGGDGDGTNIIIEDEIFV